MSLERIEFLDGAEFTLDMPDRWVMLCPRPGEVIELLLSATDHGSASRVWVGFLVVESTYTPAFTVAFRAKFLGVNDAGVAKEFSARFNRRVGWIHLCGSRPCVEADDYALHATQARWWTLEAFQPSYLTPAVRRQVKKWLEAEQIPEPAGAAPLVGAIVGAVPKSGAFKPEFEEHLNDYDYEPESPYQGDGMNPPAGDVPPEVPEEHDFAEEVPPPTGGTSREFLRQQLRQVRDRIGPGNGIGAPMPPQTPVGGTGGKETKGSIFSKPAAEARMSSGSQLHALGNRPGAFKLEDAKGSTTKHSRGPAYDLMQQAINNMSLRKQAQRQKKKKHKKNPSDRLASALKEAFRPQKKKRKARHPGDGPPDDEEPDGSSSWTDSQGVHHHRKKKRRRVAAQPDGAQLSYSESCSTASEEEESSETTDLEAPMKKKSMKKPGGVLAMLVSHIRSQMSQTSLLDLDPTQDTVTQGVKVTSYFGMHIRPQFPGATNQLRDLYSLARALDTLRMGDIGSASDQLAGRFIAIHQSLVDGGWATAKYMELTPLEDASAATPSLVLATRRHSKVCSKVQGLDGYGGGYGFGRGKGKQSWSGWGREGEKGEAGNKGKGKNNKGKGKNQDSRGRGKGGGQNPWANNLEKAEEKPPTKWLCQMQNSTLLQVTVEGPREADPRLWF